MKKVKALLALCLLCMPLWAQAQKQLFDKYGDKPNVSSVYISKAMIEMNPSLFADDIYIGKVSGQLNSVQVLSSRNVKMMEEMRKDVKAMVKSSRYELLMKQKNSKSNSEFYMNRKGEKVKELIMVIDASSYFKFVYLEGDMTLKDIRQIMLYQQSTTMYSPETVIHLGNELAIDDTWKEQLNVTVTQIREAASIMRQQLSEQRIQLSKQCEELDNQRLQQFYQRKQQSDARKSLSEIDRNQKLYGVRVYKLD